MKPHVFALLALLALTSGPQAKTVAIAVDVSGSMKDYGQWQSDAVTALTSILAGALPPNRWRFLGQDDAARTYALASGDRAVILRFGNARSADFPFFQTPNVIPAPTDLATLFPVQPKDYAEGKTNKTLAEVVSARLASQETSDGLVLDGV